mmetsp:Transcript_18544/g.25713  ORF Transcript_18544/g.25713 Transcript_18544/m.25713 type:complete len:230 (+) Transcript_18544:54-743(+)
MNLRPVLKRQQSPTCVCAHSGFNNSKASDDEIMTDFSIEVMPTSEALLSTLSPSSSSPRSPLDMFQVSFSEIFRENSFDSHVSSSSLTCPTSIKSKKNVSFDQIQVREYERALGDNPSVRQGVPISIGWNYTKQRTTSVDEYETNRPSEKRRPHKQLQIKAQTRRCTLVNDWSVPKEDVKHAMQQVKVIQRQRRETAKLPEVIEDAQEIVEITGKRIQGIFSGLTDYVL